MADGSARVVLIALAGNLAIALVKFVAWMFTGSTALFTEAIHSLVDTGDQVLLLIGQTRAKKPPDATHPLGYGMETYFWSFIVALMVFLVGGAVSIWQGIERIRHPAPIEHPWLSYVVLGASAVFEGTSFMAAYREYCYIVRGRRIPLWQFIKLSKDPGVFSTLLEDGAAVTGLAIAALGVTGAAYLGAPWADGAASIAIGLLLVWVATFLANETRSLIAGEAAAPPVVEAVKDLICQDPRVVELDEVLSLHLGPSNILFAASVRYQEGLSGADVLDAAQELAARVKTADKRIGLVFLRPHETVAAAAKAAEAHGPVKGRTAGDS